MDKNIDAGHSLFSCMKEIPDPRKPYNQRHRFLDVVIIAVLAILSGMDTWYELHDWALFSLTNRQNTFIVVVLGCWNRSVLQSVIGKLSLVAAQRCLAAITSAVTALCPMCVTGSGKNWDDCFKRFCDFISEALQKSIIYILVYTIGRKKLVIMMTAKVFENGRSQAVRLPKEYRFNTDEVAVNKIGNIVMLVLKTNKWDSFMRAIDMFSEDFMEDGRRDEMRQEREDI